MEESNPSDVSAPPGWPAVRAAGRPTKTPAYSVAISAASLRPKASMILHERLVGGDDVSPEISRYHGLLLSVTKHGPPVLSTAGPFPAKPRVRGRGSAGGARACRRSPV